MLAACAAPPNHGPSPPIAASPFDTACATNETQAAELAALPQFAGKCVRVRGLAALDEAAFEDPLKSPDANKKIGIVYLYKDAADFSRWQGPRDHTSGSRLALLWRAGPPDAFGKKYPQFVEVSGRLLKCVDVPDCRWASEALIVTSFKIFPTAMD